MLKFVKYPEMTNNERFIHLVGRLKEINGTSQNFAADKIGLSTSTMSRIKNGKAEATEKMINDLLVAFPELDETGEQDSKANNITLDEARRETIKALKKVVDLQERLYKCQQENEKLKAENERLKIENDTLKGRNN